MELYEKGYLPKEDLNKGPEPIFGSSEAIVYYTKAIAFREGLGTSWLRVANDFQKCTDILNLLCT